MKVIQCVGFLNSGKTTLLCGFVEYLVDCGFRVGTVKHHAHSTPLDVSTKDTARHRFSGAAVTAALSPQETLWSVSGKDSLPDIVSKMRGYSLDYLIVEGFKHEAYSKIVLVRDEHELMSWQGRADVIAFAAREDIRARMADYWRVFSFQDIGALLDEVEKKYRDE